MPSDIRPNASASYLPAIRGAAPRGAVRSARSPRKQAAAGVADGHADEVVGGHAPGHLLLAELGPDEVALLDALADADGRRLAQQLLEPDGAEVPPGGGDRG